jgi:hypothetical protein
LFNSLASSRERDQRFDLALIGIPCLPKEEVIVALQERKDFLLEAATHIVKKFKLEGGDNLPFHTKAVFKHPLFLIKNEINFTDSLISELKQAK